MLGLRGPKLVSEKLQVVEEWSSTPTIWKLNVFQISFPLTQSFLFEKSINKKFRKVSTKWLNLLIANFTLEFRMESESSEAFKPIRYNLGFILFFNFFFSFGI